MVEEKQQAAPALQMLPKQHTKGLQGVPAGCLSLPHRDFTLPQCAGNAPALLMWWQEGH